MMNSPLSPLEYVRAAEILMATKIYSLAACIMLFYDICLTFGEEVEKIWKRRFTCATVLWIMNRYINPLGYIVVIVSFHQRWSTSVCTRYVHYPEILKTITDTAIGFVFILRLYAIYSRSRTVLFVFLGLLLAEIGVKIWSFSDGVALQLPPGLVGCILTAHSEGRFIWTFIVELIFDSCVLFATLIKAHSIYHNLSDDSSMIIRVIIRDGVVYFAVISAANLLTVTFLLAASPDLKPINATFGNMLTSLMVSRIMLNLRIGNDQEPQIAVTHTTVVRDVSMKTHGLRGRVMDAIADIFAQEAQRDSSDSQQVLDQVDMRDEVMELIESYTVPRASHVIPVPVARQ